MMSNTSSDMEHCSNLTKESEFFGLCCTQYCRRRLLLLLRAESNSRIGVLPGHSPLPERCPRGKFPSKHLVIHPPRSDDEEEMERKQKDLLFRQDCTVIYKVQKVQLREDLLI